MNVIAGIVIGFISKSWMNSLTYPFIWGAIHVLYGFIFRTHDNPVVKGTQAGNPVASYYITRYLTGSLTSLLFAIIAYAVVRFLI